MRNSFPQSLLLVVLTSCVFFQFASGQSLQTVFEKSGAKETPTYFQAIEWWKKLDLVSGKVKMLEMGMTDAGYPLHLVVIANNGDHHFERIGKAGKNVVLINNGIHPGEPDGIDASMLLARDIVEGKTKIPDQMVLAIIPVYNIGGCLNRSTNFRVDQNGPDEFGFRGNSQNLDLNRDAIKCDSKDARAFTEIFRMTDPDVFIDNHVSNGADYQHVMTLLTTQHNKLGGEMGKYLSDVFEPRIYDLMKEKGFDLVPYVNAFGDTPENGWPEFWDSPRYLSGYAALWQTFAFVPEAHMLKPYAERVAATKALMESFISFVTTQGKKIKALRMAARDEIAKQERFAIDWKLDRTQTKGIIYKGYEAGRKASEVSGLPRLYYDRNRPFEKTVPVFNQYIPETFVEKPRAYVIPRGWWKVTELLRLNRVQMRQLTKDSSIRVQVYRIEDYKTAPRQYEMHHPNSEVKVSVSEIEVHFNKGDWIIPMNQYANRFLIETLEPHAEDSYFSWNFFDAILGQKEGYSAYAFEDIAAGYLEKNPALRNELEEKKKTDTTFAKNGRAQLYFVYQHSPWYEPAHMRYPVYRVVN
jgi:hypothetical protein